MFLPAESNYLSTQIIYQIGAHDFKLWSGSISISISMVTLCTTQIEQVASCREQYNEGNEACQLSK